MLNCQCSVKFKKTGCARSWWNSFVLEHRSSRREMKKKVDEKFYESLEPKQGEITLWKRAGLVA